MFCRHCGTELPSGARFCPKCRAEVLGKPVDGPHTNGTKVPTNGMTVLLAEGILSVLLVFLVLFAPVVRIDYFIGERSMSIIDAILKLSDLSEFLDLDEFAALVPALVVLMLIACVGAALNARKAFASIVSKTIEPFQVLSISTLLSSAVTFYALAIFILLRIVSKESYGVVTTSGWIWLLLVGGIACQVLHFLGHLRES